MNSCQMALHSEPCRDPTVCRANAQFDSKLRWLSGFSPDNQADNRLADTDDAVQNAARPIVTYRSLSFKFMPTGCSKSARLI